MASPLQSLATFVPPAARGRGQLLAEQRRVRLLEVSAARLGAVVEGTTPITLTIVRHGDTLVASCPCVPEMTTPCEHAWACLVQAASQRAKILRSPGPAVVLVTQARRQGSPGSITSTGGAGTGVPGAGSAFRQLGMGRLLHARPPPAPRSGVAPSRAAGVPGAAAGTAPQRPAKSPPLPHYVLRPTTDNEVLQLDLLIAPPPRIGPLPSSTFRLEWQAWRAYQGTADGDLLDLVIGRPAPDERGRYGRFEGANLRGATRDRVLELAVGTGRCFLARPGGGVLPLGPDDSGPWAFVLHVGEAPDGGFQIEGRLRRGDRTVRLADARLLFSNGTLLLDDRVGRFDHGGGWSWVDLLRSHGTYHYGPKYRGAFLEELYALPRRPILELPAGHEPAVVAVAPVPCLLVRAGEGPGLVAALSFDYLGTIVPAGRPGRVAFDAAAYRVAQRDPSAEAVAARTLAAAGFSANPRGAADEVQIASARLGAAVHTLIDAGFRVEAKGKVYRKAGAVRVALRSGTDWFDLRGHVDFEGSQAALTAVLAAARCGEEAVVLDDGTLGLLPDEWLERHGFLVRLGEIGKDAVRFRRSQVGLLDALLEAQPEVDVDARFRAVRDELRSFERIAPEDPPPSFTGTLRGYQREGLGWLSFLQRFGFGGCLADEMGLGKTIQVLALLASREGAGPSLVVAPRSLIFNWRDEAAKFVPSLRVLEHTGASRLPPGPHFREYDLVLTTYGTLRRDAPELATFAFDYAILDEAQAIKNDGSEAAKAARLLQASHRLILSGTPVENHLGELWSLFEFMNPGMLGALSAFRAASGDGIAPDAPARLSLARVLRPFLLRRTKAAVAPELPPRVEETLLCELGSEQRAFYQELRLQYRSALLGRVKQDGMGRSAIHVLEALLRLRQAACHPGLVDEGRKGGPSAKLEALFHALAPVLEGGHKAVVFSQFTSLLALVRDRLDREGVAYAYLDGKTRDRAAPVLRFQTDAGCPLFLVSIKAGGTGLNLTAAEYVFLLDPWWNPAVEAQAMDRAHRIGQTRTVFAYRLVAKDTIEERILALQAQKRSLAESLFEGAGGVLQDLTAEDLERLLS